MIDRLTEEKIKDAAKIVDVVGDFLDLKKKGVEYTATCPFHQDKHLGNFMISPKRNIAKCFSCDWSGDPIKFLMEYGTGMTFKEALMWLAKKYNIPCEDAKNFAYTPPPPRPPVPQLPTLILPKHIMARTVLDVEQNTLVQWMRNDIRWDTVQRKRISEVLAHYSVGHSKQGMTVFWLMDNNGDLHTGKMMRYNPDGQGARIKGITKTGFTLHSVASATRPTRGHIPSSSILTDRRCDHACSDSICLTPTSARISTRRCAW